MELTLTLTSDPDVDGRTVVVAAGSLDLATRDRFVAFGASALRSSPAQEFVLDLSGVTFLDSVGVGALVKLNQMAQDEHRTMVLHHPSKRVARLLQLVGLDDVWPVESG
jgi:anti-anti-sigma factor